MIWGSSIIIEGDTRSSDVGEWVELKMEASTNHGGP